MKLLLVYNPCAGNGRARRSLAEVEDHARNLGLRVETRLTGRRGHATEIVRTADLDAFDGIIAAGGDGTVFEVAPAAPLSDRLPRRARPLRRGRDLQGASHHHGQRAPEDPVARRRADRRNPGRGRMSAPGAGNFLLSREAAPLPLPYNRIVGAGFIPARYPEAIFSWIRASMAVNSSRRWFWKMVKDSSARRRSDTRSEKAR